jgi:phosphate transport system substrate-binding protein
MRKWVPFAATVALVAAVAVVVAGGTSAAPQRQAATTLTGAGATFPAPLIAQWQKAVPSALGIEVNYSPIGSGGGIAAITSRTVDFGASDAPLSPDQFKACNGCVQIPWALSATSVAYNVPGVKNLLHVTGKVLADIYMGKITKWNDPALRKLNKGVALPEMNIVPVHRSDNSGTSFNFTDYLSSVSAEWKSKLGRGTSVNWIGGTGARGSSGVAGVVAQTQGAIGYFDVAYALANKLKFFAVQNRSGKFATPGLRGIKAAAESDPKPAADNELSIVNPPKKFKNAYPISTYTYVLLPLQSSKAPDLKKFIFWALTKGQTFGPKLLFQPIPKSTLVVAEKTLKRIRA